MCVYIYIYIYIYIRETTATLFATREENMCQRRSVRQAVPPEYSICRLATTRAIVHYDTIIVTI